MTLFPGPTQPGVTAVVPPTPAETLIDILTICEADGFPTGIDTFGDWEPNVLATKHGLDPKSFGATKKKPWGAFAMLDFQQGVWDAAEAYAMTFVDHVYPDDAAVASDVQLAAWVAHASTSGADGGGNLGKFFADWDGSKHKLCKLLAYLLYAPLNHAATNLPGLNMRMIHGANLVGLTMLPTLPDASQTYDLQTVVDTVLASSFLMQRIANFNANFLQNLIPKKLLFDEDSPFASDGPFIFDDLPAGHPLNAAQVTLADDINQHFFSTIAEFNPTYCDTAFDSQDACAHFEKNRISRATSWR